MQPILRSLSFKRQGGQNRIYNRSETRTCRFTSTRALFLTGALTKGVQLSTMLVYAIKLVINIGAMITYEYCIKYVMARCFSSTVLCPFHQCILPLDYNIRLFKNENTIHDQQYNEVQFQRNNRLLTEILGIQVHAISGLCQTKTKS